MEQQRIDAETRVLDAFHSGQRHLTVRQLRARTALTTEELRDTLRDLAAKGELSRLNTLIESYTLRSRSTFEVR
jgi:hypothetical protein